jgi:hypothetical protein
MVGLGNPIFWGNGDCRGGCGTKLDSSIVIRYDLITRCVGDVCFLSTAHQQIDDTSPRRCKIWKKEKE